MKALLLILINLFLVSSAIHKKSTYVVLESQKGMVGKFYEKFPSGNSEIVITERNAANAGKASLHLSSLTNLYVAMVDTESSKTLKEGKLPFEVGRVGNLVFFKDVELSEIDPFLHTHDLRLIKVSTQIKNVVPSAKKPTTPKHLMSPIDVSKFYKHTRTSFNEKYLKQKLEEVSGAKPIILEGQELTIKERGSKGGRENLRRYLRKELEALGFRTWLHAYSADGANIVAQKDGTQSNEVIILSAHIDSVGNAGADDDGTGVSALIATAKAFSKIKHQYSLRIVGFDEEELGLVGSGKYFDSLASSGEVKNVKGAIHYDMTGWDSNKDGKFHILDCNENTSSEITGMMTSLIDQFSIKLKNIPACRRRSDHIRYWQYSIPAVMAIEVREQDNDVNPCYHRSCDTADTINYTYLNNITQVGAVTLLQLTGAEI